MNFELPASVREMCRKLYQSGFDAYVVGGCLRDACLGLSPHDYDIATNARPEQIISLFAPENCSEYGRAFGTVGVKYAGGFAEITTFRTEADYTDCRHPGKVEFADHILDDLSRRDFTCNAMAWNAQTQTLYDPFHGREDLEHKILRCVGVPLARFREDALRIMRGMRFCARFGFHADPLTDAAMKAGAYRLTMISSERILSELCGMLIGDDITAVLLRWPEILAVRIPEISPCIAFSQHTHWHDFTVWEHIARTVGNIPPDLTLRLTMLFHDIAKPQCFTIDSQGGHFKNHAEKSAVMADQVLKRLKSENHLRERVCRLILCHRTIPVTMKQVRHLLNFLDPQEFAMLLKVLDADRVSKLRGEPESDQKIKKAESLFHTCQEQNLCCQVRDLDIKGTDLINLGFDGKQIGIVLKSLLESVISDQIPNQKAELLALAEEYHDLFC